MIMFLGRDLDMGALKRGNFRVKLVWLPALLSVVVAVAYGDGRQANAQTIPPALESAVEKNITDRGSTYVGDCAGAVPGVDIGFCYTVVSVSEMRAVVRIGPTGAEYHRRLTFEKQGEAWVVVSDIPDDGIGAPDVGTGLAGDSTGTGEGLAGLGVDVALTLIAVSVTAVVIGRRLRTS